MEPMAFKRSAVRSRLSPPHEGRVEKQRQVNKGTGKAPKRVENSPHLTSPVRLTPIKVRLEHGSIPHFRRTFPFHGISGI